MTTTVDTAVCRHKQMLLDPFREPQPKVAEQRSDVLRRIEENSRNAAKQDLAVVVMRVSRMTLSRCTSRDSGTKKIGDADAYWCGRNLVLTLSRRAPEDLVIDKLRFRLVATGCASSVTTLNRYRRTFCSTTMCNVCR